MYPKSIIIFLGILSVLTCQRTLSQPFAHQLDWHATFSSGKESSENSSQVDFDSDGNVYSSGIIRYSPANFLFPVATIDFGPDAIQVEENQSAIYVLKQDSTGVVKWATGLSASVSIYRPLAFVVDNESSIYLTTYATGDLSIGDSLVPAPYGINNSWSFIVKMDSTGSLVWLQPFTVPYMQQMDHDADNNIYFTGFLYEQTLFGYDTLSSLIEGSGPGRFIAKMDTDGNLKWGRTVSYKINSIACASDKVYLNTAGGDSLFIGDSLISENATFQLHAIDSSGNIEWTTKINDKVSWFYPEQLTAVNDNGEITVAGRFSGVLRIGNDSVKSYSVLDSCTVWDSVSQSYITIDSLCTVYSTDLFVSKFASNGDLVSLNVFQSPGFQNISKLKTNNEYTYIGGYYNDQFSINDSSYFGDNRYFWMVIDDQAQLIDFNLLEQNLFSYWSIAVTNSNDVAISRSFIDTLSSPLNLVSTGSYDILILKYHLASLNTGTSITENSAVLTSSVFPNPSNGQISIRLDSHQQLPVKLEIVDMHGKIVLVDQLNSSMSQIDLSDLSMGVYLIQLTTRSQVMSKKLLLR